MGLRGDENGAPVWGRREVVVWECPKSLITGESEMLVEEFLLRRRLGQVDFRELSGRRELSARKVEAFTILEGELRREREYGQQHSRRDF